MWVSFWGFFRVSFKVSFRVFLGFQVEFLIRRFQNVHVGFFRASLRLL